MLAPVPPTIAIGKITSIVVPTDTCTERPTPSKKDAPKDTPLKISFHIFPNPSDNFKKRNFRRLGFYDLNTEILCLFGMND